MKRSNIVDKVKSAKKQEPEDVLELETQEEKKKKEEEKKRRIIIAIILLLILLIGFNVGEMLNAIPSRPKIKSKNNEWGTNNIVEIEKDAKAKSGIKYYLYCVSRDRSGKDCVWKKTKTKNVEITEDGEFYVFFKGVSNDGSVGRVSEPTLVRIDGTAPEIIKGEVSSTYTEIDAKVIAKDDGAGIDKYYFKLDNGEWVESYVPYYTFTGLTEDTLYKVTIKVVDKAGNEKEIELSIRTKKRENNGKTDKPAKDNNGPTDNTPGDDNGNNGPTDNGGNGNNGKPDDNGGNGNNGGDDPTPDNPEHPGGEIENPPEISLSGVPSKFRVETKYDLPTTTKNIVESTIKCTVDGKGDYKDTGKLTIGKHVIECSGSNEDGVKATVRKEVEVQDLKDEEEVWEGWIRMTLYYPEGSTDWQYIVKHGEIREEGWIDYTGPFLVRIEDVENVFIRYKMDGKTIIVAPDGRLVVDIEPNSFEVEKNSQTTVRIVYTQDADRKEYRINGGEWKTYEGSFKVGPNTQIDAKVVKTVDGEKQIEFDSVYIREKGQPKMSEGGSGPGTDPGNPGGPSGPGGTGGTGGDPGDPRIPDYALDGPTINVNTNAIVDEVEVTITTEKPARYIYYKVGSGDTWHLYEGAFTVNHNTTVYAYYVTEEEGQTSRTSNRYIGNIDPHNGPNVNIGVNTTAPYQESVVATITTNGTNLQYRLGEYDINWHDYTRPITITENTRIYARATNENGTTTEYRDITNIGDKPPVKKVDNIDITISLDPDGRGEELIDRTTVTIDYDQKANNKYYKVGSNDIWHEYTGSFEVDHNTTVYAYADNENAYGEASRDIGFLTTGIIDPKIIVNPTTPASRVSVSIDYAAKADTKQYKIDNGEWQDYAGSFDIEKNCIIYARNTDSLGHTGESSKVIDNIVPEPNYVLLDLGDYYILYPNYPEDSLESSREYKWTPTGTWKHYVKELGILLIKERAWDRLVIDNASGVQVQDEKGNTRTYTDHYYKVDNNLKTITEDLFMRWGYSTPADPTIVLSTEEPTKKLTVSISYGDNASNKEYKLLYNDGRETEWMKYTEPFEITENLTVYARSSTSKNIYSNTISRKITNIDKIKPVINYEGELARPQASIALEVTAEDNLGVKNIGWMQGEHTADEVEEDGSVINGSSVEITIEENGKYTLYARDKAGNTNVRVIEITNIDKTKPEIEINVLTQTLSSTVEVEIDYGNSITKEYKIGENSEYVPYTGVITLTSEEVKDLANSDKKIVIYARGTNEAGNTGEVSKVINELDVDYPAVPVITRTGNSYATLSNYEITDDREVSIAFDEREGIKNYYSYDGENWALYEGAFTPTKGTVYAKSIKDDSLLTAQAEQEVIPADAMPKDVFDDSFEAVNVSNLKDKYMEVSSNMIGHYIGLSWEASNADDLKIEFYNENKELISSVLYDTALGEDSDAGVEYAVITNDENQDTYGLQEVKIPENTRYLSFNYTTNTGSTVSELVPYKGPILSTQDGDEQVYPHLTKTGVIEKTNLSIIDKFGGDLMYMMVSGDDYTLSDPEIYQNEDIEISAYDGIIMTRSDDKYMYYSGLMTELAEDSIPNTIYDGNINRGVIISVDDHNNGDDRRLKLDDLTGYQLSITWEADIANDGDTHLFIVFKNADGSVNKTEDLSTSGHNLVTSIVDIPSGAKEISIYTTSQKLSLYEITSTPITNNSNNNPGGTEGGEESGEEQQAVPATIPVISVSNVNEYDTSKTVTIDYVQGPYNNQYSYDAEEWYDYVEPLTISEPTTIYARTTRMNGHVETASSFKITKVGDNTNIGEEEEPDPAYINVEYVYATIGDGPSGNGAIEKPSQGRLTRPESMNSYFKYSLENGKLTGDRPEACIYNEARGGELCLKIGNSAEARRKILDYFGYDENTWTNNGYDTWKSPDQTISCNISSDGSSAICNDTSVGASNDKYGSISTNSRVGQTYLCDVSESGAYCY